MSNYDFASETLPDLGAGVFVQKVSKALADVALGVVEHGRKGRVTLTLELERIGESHQVNVKHTVAFRQPTLRGTRQEDDATETPMFVGRGGRLSFVPESQGDMFCQHDQEAQ